MFFTGTLQEGISTALQQSKLVVCFVTDNEDEGKKWETEYLTEDSIARSLETDAVVLRLEAGSQEAGYLAAIFPLPRNPTLVIIKNGELKEYISAGTSKGDFVRRVSGAFQAQTASQAQADAAPAVQSGGSTGAVASTPSTTAATASVPADDTSPSSQPSGLDTPASISEQPAAQPSEVERIAEQTARARALTEEGERRRQAARKEREEIEKERRRKAKGKMPEVDPKKAQQDDAVKKASQQLAERQKQAREERSRVLKRIEDDKAERKAREEMRRAEREMGRRAAMGEDVDAATVTAEAGEPAPSSTMKQKHDQCAIQVRLFDGSTIRTRLPSKATLAQDVRKWIDEARTDGSDPYTFKVILTPMPNRSIDPATEEDQTLEELELTPSSTLVLTPVERYSAAYTSINAGLTSPVSRLIAAGLAIIMGIFGMFSGTFLGSGSGANTGSGAGQSSDAQQDRTQSQSQSQAQAQAHATGRDGGSRIKGFENPDDRQRDYQLYNGNSLNFEPRKDEEEEDN